MEYESQYSKYQVHFLGEKPEFLDNIDIDLNSKKVVDLGCGGGINSYYIKDKFPDCYLIPLDVSLIRCTGCKDNTKCVPVQADICNIPLKSASTDFVVCTMVIEHVFDDVLLLREILRILKPGGTALVSSVVKADWAWYFRKNKAGQRVLDSTHLREYASAEDFKSLFSSFKIKKVFVKKIAFSPFRFLYRLLYRLGIIKDADASVFINNAVLSKLLRFKVGIPGFKAVEVLCEVA